MVLDSERFDHLHWHFVNDRIFINAICASSNPDILAKCPHKIIGDIAGVYVMPAYIENERKIVTMTYESMERYGLDKYDLHDLAVKNSTEVYPIWQPTIFEYVKETQGRDIVKNEPDVYENTPWYYILTNKQAENGASAIFYPGVFETIGSQLPEGCLMDCSSKEFIMYISKNEIPVEWVQDDIEKIKNDVTFEERWFLSDKVHYYDPKNKRITVIEKGQRFEHHLHYNCIDRVHALEKRQKGTMTL